MDDSAPADAPSAPALGDVSATCLITLFGRALESASASTLLRDPQAEIMADALRPAMLASEDRLHQRLARSRLNKQMKVDLDLPEVIALKRRYLQEDGDRYRMLARSVLDHDWMDEIAPPDEPDPKLGVLRWFRRFDLFRKSQWLVRYRLR